MSLNERIKKLRKHLGMTQAEFGRRIGIVQGHLTGLESGKKRVTPKTLRVICSTYGVSEKWLEDGTGDMFAENPDKKANGLIRIFTQLDSEYQDYMLKHLQSLLRLQKKQIPGASEKLA